MDHHYHILIAAVLLAVSCSPKIVEKVKTEYVYQNVYQRDTTIVRDSIYIKE